jgi:uncharacterized membrane protein YebE (DUF533 family)
MNTLLQKKINLLLHLAKVDGHLDDSEKKLIQEILVEAGEGPEVDWSQSTAGALEASGQIHDREKLLHWALKLIKIDGVIHIDEVAFCKALAIKLKFKPSIVDYFVNKELPGFDEFAKLAGGHSF